MAIKRTFKSDNNYKATPHTASIKDQFKDVVYGTAVITINDRSKAKEIREIIEFAYSQGAKGTKEAGFEIKIEEIDPNGKEAIAVEANTFKPEGDYTSEIYPPVKDCPNTKKTITGKTSGTVYAEKYENSLTVLFKRADFNKFKTSIELAHRTGLLDFDTNQRLVARKKSPKV